MAGRFETTDHADCNAGPIDGAATWLSRNWQTVERPLLPAIRDRFGLGSAAAIEVIRAARKIATEADNAPAS